MGGTDTTTTMVEWTMAELLKHPEEMRKVQQELTEVVGLSNMVEESHLSQLTYLDAAIKETLRLHPILPLLASAGTSQRNYHRWRLQSAQRHQTLSKCLGYT